MKDQEKKYKIAIIGPGFSPIPPTGWGAVESLVWDYYTTLTSDKHTVKIINTSNPNEIIKQTNDFDPEIVHIQYDDWAELANHFKCKNIIATSHFAYLEQTNKHGGYSRIFNMFFNPNLKIFCLSNGIMETYKKFGKDENSMRVVPNGVRSDLFKYIETPEDKSIYLAKIDYRKGQYKYHDIENLYFAGNIADDRYNKNNYLGEWTKRTLYNKLGEYSNLVLLSDGEAHPLVCMEGLSAGLGLVISEYAAANLDCEKEYIDVIPHNKLNDVNYISEIIVKNRKTSRLMRKEIIEYSKSFDWKNIISNYYLPSIKSIFNI